MICMRTEIRAGLIKFIVEFQVQTVGLKVRDDEYRGHAPGKLAEGVKDILSLQRDAFTEALIMNLRGPTHFVILGTRHLINSLRSSL